VFAVFRPLAALLTGVLGGALVKAAGGEQPQPEARPIADAATAPRQRLQAALRYGFETLPRDIGKALVIGLVLAALITALVPAGSLAGVLGGGLVPIILMMVVSIPLYVCATGSVPLAAGFIHAGVSPGAALAFLIAGPTTNAAMVTTLFRILGRRVAIIYLATVAASAVGGGLLLDAMFRGLDLHLAVLHTDHHHESIGWLDHAWAGLLVLNLGWVFRPRRRPAAGDGAMDTAADQTVVLQVRGMTCSHCQGSVERTLGAQAGVRDVTVDLPAGRAVVVGEALDAAALSQAVNSLGFAAEALATD